MPRGGSRTGAGRKSTWASDCRFAQTKLIRVPKYIAEQVLRFAHKLDEEKTIETETKSKLPNKPTPAGLISTKTTRNVPKHLSEAERKLRDMEAVLKRWDKTLSDKPRTGARWQKAHDLRDELLAALNGE